MTDYNKIRYNEGSIEISKYINGQTGFYQDKQLHMIEQNNTLSPLEKQANTPIEQKKKSNKPRSQRIKKFNMKNSKR